MVKFYKLYLVYLVFFPGTCVHNFVQRNWVFPQKVSNFYLFKPDDVNIWNFKLIIFDLTEFIVGKSMVYMTLDCKYLLEKLRL